MAALVLGQLDPAELAGRLSSSDFTDPAAGACFTAMLDRTGPLGPVLDLPDLLRRRGQLRGDGHPIRELLDWLPSLPVPVHPQAWATLVVASSMGRVVNACGVRLLQAADKGEPDRPEAGRVLTVAAAQRATLHHALRRWEDLPAGWRATVPNRTASPDGPASRERPAGQVPREPTALGSAPRDAVIEHEVLAGLVAAPVLLDRLPWLRPEDFTTPGCAEVFDVARRLHAAGRPVDRVTLAAAVPQAPATSRAARAPGSSPAEVCARLRPEGGFPATVPFLARRLVELSAVRATLVAGQDLVALAGAPGAVGGLGGPVLHAALARVDRLRPLAERLEQATRPVHAQDRSVVRQAPSRLPAARSAAGVDRHVG